MGWQHACRHGFVHPACFAVVRHFAVWRMQRRFHHSTLARTVDLLSIRHSDGGVGRRFRRWDVVAAARTSTVVIGGTDSGSTMTAMFSRWWRADQHGWLSGYFEARGISSATRVLMASIAASMVLCLLALLTSRDGPRGTVPVMMTWVGAAGGIAGVLLWVWRWPTRAQSVAFAVTCNTAVALACLAHPNPLPALIGCVAFATFGAYIRVLSDDRIRAVQLRGGQRCCPVRGCVAGQIRTPCFGGGGFMARG